MAFLFLLLLLFIGSYRIPVQVHTSTLYLTTVSFLTVNTLEEEQVSLSPAENSWESRMPDSCRDLMQESTSSRPVVSSSSMSFCPSMQSTKAQDKRKKIHWLWSWVWTSTKRKRRWKTQESFSCNFTSHLQNCRRWRKTSHDCQRRIYFSNLRSNIHWGKRKSFWVYATNQGTKDIGDWSNWGIFLHTNWHQWKSCQQIMNVMIFFLTIFKYTSGPQSLKWNMASFYNIATIYIGKTCQWSIV